jgi:acyl-ACP thioesterase
LSDHPAADWYADEYRVYHKDIDFQGELRLSALLLMLQETAWNHAHVLGLGYSSAAFKDLVWVLSRMRIELLAPGPGWMQGVRLQTSPTGVERLFAMRDFLATDGAGRPFARISSAWILIDSASRRPVRPESVINPENYRIAAPIMETRPFKLREPADGVELARHRTAWSDIDAHRHVNNVRYAEWCLDTYQAEDWKRRRLIEYDINFNAEMLWEQELSVSASREAAPAGGLDWTVAGRSVDERHTHVIRRLSDGVVAAVVRFGWENRPQEESADAQHPA